MFSPTKGIIEPNLQGYFEDKVMDILQRWFRLPKPPRIILNTPCFSPFWDLPVLQASSYRPAPLMRAPSRGHLCALKIPAMTSLFALLPPAP